LKRSDHLIAVSPFLETYLRQRHRFQGEIRVIPNMVPALPPEIKPVEKYPKTGQVAFGCYGGSDRLKNVKAAIAAFRIAAKELPGSRLLIFGPGWEKLQHEYEQDRIEFRGHAAHSIFLQSLATEVDIWIHPSRIETQSITVCEAIQTGCPVIAGRGSGAVPWTLDYGAAGILVDIEDPARIAEAMTALCRDRGKGLSLVSYGREMIRERFSPERVVDMHLSYYEDVIRAWKQSRKI
jgi:glycosyltransferase involved in cell wall biosynthesis